jgi:hypothetical protein
VAVDSTVADACRMLAKSGVELAARRRRTQLPHSLPPFIADDLDEDESGCPQISGNRPAFRLHGVTVAPITEKGEK